MAGGEFAYATGGVQGGSGGHRPAIQLAIKGPLAKEACAKEDSSLLLILSCHSIKGLFNPCKCNIQHML
jgi:hypothetical protein